MYKNVMKRAMDIIISFISLVLLSWLFAVIILCIRITSRGPAFFMQKRIGKNKNTFEMFKFRTMLCDTPAEVPTHLLKNPDRFITPIGHFLRITSLDELPQLINILKGDMSLVGPRPALWNQYDLIAEREKYGANDIKPGLTGWAQVNGRDEIPIPIKAGYDGEYVRKMSIWLDLRCILMTIKCVIKKDGIKEGVNEEEKL